MNSGRAHFRASTQHFRAAHNHLTHPPTLLLPTGITRPHTNAHTHTLTSGCRSKATASVVITSHESPCTLIQRT